MLEELVVFSDRCWLDRRQVAVWLCVVTKHALEWVNDGHGSIELQLTGSHNPQTVIDFTTKSVV